MNHALRIILGIEIALGVLWTLVGAMAYGAGGLGAIGVMLVVYALFAVFFLVAAWSLWKYPAERRTSIWIMLLPIVFWFAPLMIRSMAGEYLSVNQLGIMLLLAAIALLALCWIMPRRVTRFIPDGLIRSRLFNWFILLAVIGGWLFFIFVIVYVASEDTSRGAGGEGLAIAIILAVLYLIWLGVGSLIAATWAWLCLRSETADRSRKLSIAQLVVSLPSALLGVLVAVWLSSQGHL